jgi:hypothetical protein
MAVLPIIPALGGLGQEVHEFETSLGYIVRPYLKTNKHFLELMNNIASIHCINLNYLRVTIGTFYCSSLQGASQIR